ncbi:MAG TPA: FAD:protein FMN transferase [Phycisphaerae bacterium]|nr:FAD:protein FMN transferase [Phycisphaerae bacterium]HOJ56528.1 FAD:protein FMN transferase [Phycisphaerae bacterium]HOL28343.1 FAD:protein FMN transferase [Phycisphaerae bacterium]HPU34755.1 FAD:protein FMN transferase [Phycisphaerae bacterium]HQA46035.1 FAD:protein FMN transferase [Phycisphaerae bacterium]
MEDARGWSRRNFLSARGLGASAGGMLALLFDDDAQPSNAGRTYTYWTMARRAMACEFSILLPPDHPAAWAAGETALAVIDDMEDLLSAYRGDSLLSYLNQNAARDPVRVDERLYLLLKRCMELYEQTEGAFDASAGALIKAWGFFRGPRRVPTEEERQAALARTGMKHLELNDDERTVRYRVEGLELNLGSIGKGYAIDRAVQRVREEFGVESLLMQGGLSSIRAIGSPSGDDRGWLVGIQNPFDLRRRIATVRLRNRGMGTSGTANQYFEANGRRYGHVLDPRKGEPAGELGSVTVLAPDAATADALSTAFFVWGLDKTAEFCQNHRDVAALVVLNPEAAPRSGKRPSVLTFNLPREDVDLHPDGEPSLTRVLHIQA